MAANVISILTEGERETRQIPNTAGHLLRSLLNKKEYSEADFHVLQQCIEALAIAKPEADEMKELRSLFDQDFLNNTIQGHGYIKPYGYAGDFEIIDKIYTRHVHPDPPFAFWDQFFQRQAAPQAVRNRKTFFKQTLKEKLTTGERFSVLNIASGPGRDMAELFEETDHVDLLSVHCVELDENAIKYSSELCKEYLSQIQFNSGNILRLNSPIKYDLIWSAGLFDYFNDRLFVMLLKRMRSWVKEGGEIIIGNFSNNNPSRFYMENFGDWHLHHRSSEQLKKLTCYAGYELNKICIDREETGINLFLRITI